MGDGVRQCGMMYMVNQHILKPRMILYLYSTETLSHTIEEHTCCLGPFKEMEILNLHPSLCSINSLTLFANNRHLGWLGRWKQACMKSVYNGAQPPEGNILLQHKINLSERVVTCCRRLKTDTGEGGRS